MPDPERDGGGGKEFIVFEVKIKKVGMKFVKEEKAKNY